MVTQLNYSLHTIEPGAACALPRRARQTICASDHPLWLSQQGRGDDVVVAAGDCVTLSGRGLVVVQAFGERTSFRVIYTESAGELWITRVRDIVPEVERHPDVAIHCRRTHV